jgi:serine/threonine protein kinase
MDAENRVHENLKKCCRQHGSIPIIKKLKGFLLDNRYMISKKLNEGAFGQIYSGFDMKTTVDGVQKPIVLKFSKKHGMNDAEFAALAEVGERAHASGTDFVETYGKGKALILDRELRNVKHFSQLADDEMMKAFDDQVWSYIVQE